MTNQEITEALRLIERMRDDLPIIAGISKDADKLIDYVISSRVGEHLALSGAKLWRLVAPQESFAHWSEATRDNASTLDSMYAQLTIVLALAEMSKRRPDDYKPTLLEATTKMLQRFTSGLDQIEQSLRSSK